MYQCVFRILETWDILVYYFQLAVFEDEIKSAEFILGELQNSYTKAYLLFLKYVLNYFNSFNALFQSRSILLHKLSSASKQLIKEFCSNFLKVDILNQTCLSKIDLKNPNYFLSVTSIFFGCDCENLIKDLPKSNIEQIKSTYLSFYITAASEMKSRLPIDSHNIYKLFISSYYILYFLLCVYIVRFVLCTREIIYK